MILKYVLVVQNYEGSLKDKQMKRVGNLYEKIYDLDNIRLAHEKARKGKKHYKEVKLIDANVEMYVNKLHELLKNKEFANSKYTVFTKIEGGKERVIHKLPYFPDRVVHHAILQVLEPIWVKTFISHTYQSIKGRGVHKAKEDVTKAIKSLDANSMYYLQLDIKKFYPSVNNSILKEIVRRKIKCKDTLWLLDTIIDSTDGLPIGNYISQYLGNLYLTYLDHYVKEVLKVDNYFRYCDDIVVICDNEDFLREVQQEITSKLECLKLSVKDGSTVRPVAEGIDFLGFVFYPDGIQLRSSIKKTMYKTAKVPSNYRAMVSYFGWIKAVNAKGLWKSISNIRYNIGDEFQVNPFNPLRRLYVI